MSFMPYVAPEQLMKDRSEYAHKGIARGRSVIGLDYADGLLFLAENPSTTLHKISEVYDQIAFAGRRQVQRVRGAADRRHPSGRPARLPVRSRGREGARSRERVLAGALDDLHPADEAVRDRDPGRRGRRRGDAAPAIYHILFDGSVSDEQGYVAMGGHAEELTRRSARPLPAGLGPPDRRPHGGADAWRRPPRRATCRRADRGGRARSHAAAAAQVPPARRPTRSAAALAEPGSPRSSRPRHTLVRYGPPDLRHRERVRGDLHVPGAAASVARRGRPVPVPARRALGAVVERLPGERRAPVSRRRLAPRVRDTRVRSDPRAGGPRQGGGADPRAPAGGGGGAAARGGHRRRGLPVQEQHRLRGQLLRVPRELPGCPARASSRGWPTC